MDINNLSLEKKKELYNQLLNIFGIKNYELDKLSVKNGKVVKYSRGYGPYDDEWDEVSANRQSNVVEKFKLMVILNKKIEEDEHQNYLNLNDTINILASKYSEEDLRMD